MSWAEKLERMKTMPMGKMKTATAFKLPAVTAAREASPKWAIKRASERPTTTWVEREMMIGQASLKSSPRLVLGACSVAVKKILMAVQGFERLDSKWDIEKALPIIAGPSS